MYLDGFAQISPLPVKERSYETKHSKLANEGAEGALEQSPVVTIKSMCDALHCLQDRSTRIQNANQHNRRPDLLLCRCVTEGCFAEFRTPCTGRQILSRGTIVLMCEEAFELVWDGSDLSLFVPHYAKKAAKLVEECRKNKRPSCSHIWRRTAK